MEKRRPLQLRQQTAPLPIRKRQPMAQAMARQIKPPIAMLPTMQLPREVEQHCSTCHPHTIVDCGSNMTSSAAAPMRHSSRYVTSSAHHQPQQIRNIIGRGMYTVHSIVSRGIYATTTAAIAIQHCATIKAAASTIQQQPQLQCNNDSRAIYET